MNPLADWVESPRKTWARLGVIAGLTIFLIVVFVVFFKRVGPAGFALIAIPVALAGWYFGIGAGLIASFAGIILSVILLTTFEGYHLSTWIVDDWPGNLMLIVVGYISGRLQKEWVGRMHLVGELRSRERFLTVVSITTRDILNPQNLEDRYDVLLTHLVNLYVADYAHLIRWDETQEKAILTATTAPLEKPFSEIVLDSNESEPILWTMENRLPLIIDDVPASKYILTPAPISKVLPPAQAALCIPFVTKEYKFGVVVLAFNRPRHFTSEDIENAELASSQITLALYTIRQESKIKNRLKETRSLANIERALSETERVGIETVLQLIVDSAKELIPEAKEAVLHLLDEERKILMPRAVAGIKNKTTKRLNIRLGEGIAGQVIMTREIISVSDTQTDPRFFNQAEPVKIRSLIVAPIQSNARSVGTISVQSEQPNVFTPDEAQLLGALGTQAAIAIENANLLDTTRRDLKEINALYHINQGLVASLDPDQLMKDVVDFLHQNYEYYHVQIYTLDPESGNLIARQGSGKIGTMLKQRGYYLPVGAGIIGHTAETGIPFVTNNVDEVVFFIRNPLLPDTQSELTAPIKVNDLILGVLDIQQVPPGRLTSRDMQLMTTVADQLAVALQKANLYAELQASLSQEKAMRSQLIQSERLAVAGRLLASVSHELKNPLQAIQNALFLLKDEEKLSAQGSQDMELILSETERMAIMLDRLRTTFRSSRAEDIQDIQLNTIIEDVHALTATHMRHNDINFKFQPDPELPVVPGNHDQIRQVILNLFVNAIEAMQGGGYLTVCSQLLPERDKILLSVTDTGQGIDPEILPHVFEPFVTSKESGTGLGLAITHDIIHQHGGDILAENNPEGGATFKVWLPVNKEG